jgi:small GTP-binding protein
MARYEILINEFPKHGEYHVNHPEYDISKFTEFAATKLSGKLIVLGDPSVGKTCLINTAITRRYQESCATVGVQYTAVAFVMNGSRNVANIWDIAGQQQYQEVVKLYFRCADTAFLCFDLSRPATLANLPQWKARLDDVAQGVDHLFLVGCKSDIQQVVQEAEIQQFAQSIGAEYFKTSAYSDLNTLPLLRRSIALYALHAQFAKGRGVPRPIQRTDHHAPEPPPTVDVQEAPWGRTKKKKCCQ